MGDLFSDAVPSEWIARVLRKAREFPSTRFMFLTKNPARYGEFLDLFPRGSVLGATIETNRDDLARSVSRAPPPLARHEAMAELRWPYKYVSIEPIMDFDLDVMVSWVADIRPVSVHVGYDNWNSRLPEPPLWKTRELVRRLSSLPPGTSSLALEAEKGEAKLSYDGLVSFKADLLESSLSASLGGLGNLRAELDLSDSEADLDLSYGELRGESRVSVDAEGSSVNVNATIRGGNSVTPMIKESEDSSISIDVDRSLGGGEGSVIFELSSSESRVRAKFRRG
ncbi:DUF5131 family protein [Acidilobus sp.]|uniref:DUF5131 family protein n=1 Tax=Acidilobus sp. TaxID=1872109 RepID=UPI003D045063